MAKAAPDSTPVPSSSWRDIVKRREGLIAFLLLLLITIPMLTKVFTSDFGTHIAMGRHIVQNLSIGSKEFLNYTAIGADNFNHEWGFQAILYIFFEAGGMYAVSFLCWLTVFGIYIFLHRSITLRGGNPFLAVLMIFVFSGFLRIRIQPRPEIFTYLFISMTIYLFTEYFYGRRKKLIYLYPLLMLVWGNVHGSYLMGLALGGAFFIDALARAAWRREYRWEDLRSWIFPPVVVGLLGLVFCGLNPLGYDALLAPLHLLSRGKGASHVLMSISELTPVKQTGMLSYYKAAAAFTVVSLVLGAVGRRIYLIDLLLISIALKGAWDSARAVSMVGLFISPGSSLHFTGFFQRTRDWLEERMAGKAAEQARGSGKQEGREKTRKGKPGRRPHGQLPVLDKARVFRRIGPVYLIACLVLVVLGVVMLSFSFSQLEYGIGMTEHKFSFAAADFLRNNPIAGNMFNFFDVGGFLDWQLYPPTMTFIDGRAISQDVFLDHQKVTSALPSWKDTLNRYEVTYIVTKTMDSSGSILPIIQVLSQDPEWELVFADGLFVIFVKNIPENQAIVAKYFIPKRMLPQQIIWEAYHYMYLGVSPVVAYQTMSNMYEVMGDRAAAIQALKKALEHADVPFIRANLERLEQGGTRMHR